MKIKEMSKNQIVEQLYKPCYLKKVNSDLTETILYKITSDRNKISYQNIETLEIKNTPISLFLFLLEKKYPDAILTQII